MENQTIIAPEEVVKSTLTEDSLKAIISKRQMIIETGVRYQLKVTGANPYVNKAGVPVMIINFAAMTAYHLAEAKKHIAAGDLVSAGNKVVTASPRIGKDYVPTKGEIVDVVFEEVVTKDGEIAIFPVSITPLTKATKGFINLDDLGL